MLLTNEPTSHLLGGGHHSPSTSATPNGQPTSYRFLITVWLLVVIPIFRNAYKLHGHGLTPAVVDSSKIRYICPPPVDYHHLDFF